MNRYFIEIAYNGGAYFGWQIQPNAISVQQVLQEALATYLREPISVTGCGRTDTGVHAKHYIAHFDFAKSLNVDETAFRLNRILPKDIAVFRIAKVADDAHARFDAISRSYQYHVLTRKNPFLFTYAYQLPFKCDFDKMNEAALLLLETSDFTSFAKLHGNSKTNLCDVRRAEWVEQDEGLYVFHIAANRFLRNMVRAVVGTLLEVGKGKLSKEGFQEVILRKDRGSAGVSVPPQALYLTDIVYPYTF